VAIRHVSHRPDRLSRVIDAVAVIAATAFVFWHLRPDLLFTPTITTGGDTASHYFTAYWLQHELLPEGRLTGWVPGNYAGFPLFQIYFPLPFVAMALLAPLAGLPIAFKLVTVSGLVGLPAAVYVGFKLLRFPAPGPALAALFAVPFLFHEANSMWGANVASTLAGEFTYSIGTALLFVFAGTLYRGVESGRGWTLNGVLLAAVGLCHAYTLLAAGAFGGYIVLFHPAGRRAWSYLVKVALVAFGLMAFWLVPLLAYGRYTTAYSVVWPIDGLAQVFPPIVWPFLAVLLVGMAVTGVARLRARWRGVPRVPGDHRIGYLAALAAWSLVLYLVGWKLDVVDMRFLPFVQVVATVLAALPVASAVRWLGARPAAWSRRLVPVAAVGVTVATLGWVQTRIGFIDDWVAWNYGGFEATPGWPAFEAVNARVARTAADPRVVYEHTTTHTEAGTVRAFESLPLFAGASTLEGIYMQSTVSSPFVFYIQSEISRIPSCPLLPYHCGRLDADRAAEHLRLYNVSDVIVRTDVVREALAASSSFRQVAEVPPYTVFHVEGGTGRYVEPLRYEPLVLDRADWRADFFPWFKRPGSGEVALVHAAEADRRPDEAGPTSWARVADLPDEIPRRPLDRAVTVTEEFSAEEIRIHTSRPGHPLLVKVSYHPRWRAEGASEVWLASPSFMVIVPEREDVRLVYGPSAVDRAGLGLTAMAAVWLMGAWIGGGWIRARVVRGPDGRLDAVFAWRRLWAPALALSIGAAAVGVRMAWTDPWVPHRDGLEYFHDGDYERAEPLLLASIAAGPSSTAAYYSDYYYALCAHRRYRWEVSLTRFSDFLRRYPDADLAPEAHFRIAEALQQLGRRDDAAARFTAIIDRFPGTRWARFASEQLEAGRVAFSR